MILRVRVAAAVGVATLLFAAACSEAPREASPAEQEQQQECAKGLIADCEPFASDPQAYGRCLRLGMAGCIRPK